MSGRIMRGMVGMNGLIAAVKLDVNAVRTNRRNSREFFCGIATKYDY